jgi:NitT/TauT family transport system ATP-binding protein
MPEVDTIIQVRDLSRTFRTNSGTTLTALRSVSFDVLRGEVLGIVGPSGCGKTTLLRILAGLLTPSAGYVQPGGSSQEETQDVQTILVFQEFGKSLYPWMTIEENVRLGLHGKGKRQIAEDQVVREMIRLVGLDGFARSYPWQLSGGMQQRVALARALAREPKLLLLDEPFGSLDPFNRYSLEDEVLAWAERLGITVILVTHDLDEVVYMSDRILVMTPRPATVRTTVIVDLDIRRDQVQTRKHPRFGSIRGDIQNMLSLMRGGA